MISVPSRREAWEVYPFEVYYPDDPTRLCRLKAGQSLVWSNVQLIWGVLAAAACLVILSILLAQPSASCLCFYQPDVCISHQPIMHFHAVTHFMLKHTGVGYLYISVLCKLWIGQSWDTFGYFGFRCTLYFDIGKQAFSCTYSTRAFKLSRRTAPLTN